MITAVRRLHLTLLMCVRPASASARLGVCSSPSILTQYRRHKAFSQPSACEHKHANMFVCSIDNERERSIAVHNHCVPPCVDRASCLSPIKHQFALGTNMTNSHVSARAYVSFPSRLVFFLMSRRDIQRLEWRLGLKFVWISEQDALSVDYALQPTGDDKG
jgi:hypothetical protein